MNVSEAINRRKSIRSFTGEMPDDAAMQAILKAAEEAPVGMRQYDHYRLTVVTNKDIMAKINVEAAAFFGRPGSDSFYGAPVLVVISSEKPDAAMENPVHSSAACIAHSMALEAVEQGVGSCYIWGAIMAVQNDVDLIRQLGLPEGFVPCCGVVLGKTNEKYEPREIDEGRIAVNKVE